MLAVSAAFPTVQRHQLPEATAQINILSRVGGALGSAVFVVILTHDLPFDASLIATTSAFLTTFWWLTEAAATALVGGAWLTVEQRRTRPPIPAHHNHSVKGEPDMIRIAIIVGSTRPGRRAGAVANWVHENAGKRGDAAFEVVDIADYDLPHLDEPVPAAMGPSYSQPHTRAWAQKIASFDGYVFVTPEYNHSTSGALKNAIDYLYVEWHNKPAGFVSYGINGGTRAVEHLRQIMGELHIADVQAQVALSLFSDFENGTATLNADHHHILALDKMLDQLTAWVGALQTLRSDAQAAKAP